MEATQQAGGGINEGNPGYVHNFHSGIVGHVKDVYDELINEHQEHERLFTQVQKSANDEHAEFLEPSGEGSDAFLAYLASPQSSILGPEQEEDLNHPLSQYFVSTSHNTYLMGNQLSSVASTEAYKNVLLRGCRCVEIDVWDGKSPEDQSSSSEDEARTKDTRRLRDRLRDKIKFGKNKAANQAAEEKKKNVTPEKNTALQSPESGSAAQRAEPRVLHVCETIRDNAFVSSDLPVIVSLEVHAGLEQQEIMVEIMKHAWKDYLVDPVDASSEKSAVLPTPNNLRNKILIKVKYTAPDKKKEQEEAEEKGLQRPPSQSSASSNEDKTAKADQRKKDQPKEDQSKEGKPKKKHMLESLSELGIYTRSHHFKSWDQAEAKDPTHVFSFSEGAVKEAVENQAAALFKHNQNFLMRAYPKGSRVSSSNLTPTMFWRQGIQLVALNWQRWDRGTMINEGMFAGTGGWVLKPPNYRSVDPPLVKSVESNSSPTLHPSTAETEDHSHGEKRRSHAHSNKKHLDLTIEVLAAQDLPLPSSEDAESTLKPYIKVSVHAETSESLKTQPSALRRRLSRTRSLTRRHSRSRSRSNSNAAGGGSGGDPSAQTMPAGEKTPANEGFELQQRTNTSSSSNADFGRQKLVFSSVPIDEESLCFVRFKVEDDVQFQRDPMAAWACVRLDRMRDGVRTVRLFDSEGKVSDGILVMRVTKTYRDASAPDGAALPMR